MSHPTALIIGASRGLGLALAEEWLNRGWRVIATARGGSDRLAELNLRFSDALEIEHADIVQADTVRALGTRLRGREVDVLFVNAGIARSNDKTPVDVGEQDFVDMMLTNALAPVRTVELLGERVASDGVIALMSSELGSIANSTGFWPLYSSSKAALNMLMKGYAAERPHDPRALLLIAPGWVRTDMGGEEATLSIDESIPLVVDMVEANRGKAGLRYVDRFNRELPW
ncbi:SDR family NAD(P)-dependent oxidoreductase [Ancylobacter lacus]|uniref:SDR family NAD(P)-dependent oxidoreductase n=1 Tax=Ancylobacter lacus TaxID=2579970 RepID=UPI001BCBC93A|nr:SDR family NAD(P)-dependent oxidoreductase [Ancylobacter lacus]MBS7540004.1 SDR family NAD(P)-dependent oxidoreductase [Ancylobacter lacus]